MSRFLLRRLSPALVAFLLIGDLSAGPVTIPRRFDFGKGKGGEAATPVGAGDLFTEERGFGIEPEDKPSQEGGGLTASPGFAFSVALPEGNYDVTVETGSDQAAADTTIKSEDRRLMAERILTQPGQTATARFTVNVRTPVLPDGGRVKLTQREQGPPLARRWDGKLTLEFCGTHPSVRSVEIRPNQKAFTVFLAGDSTVTDQAFEPWAGWGQMLPRFLKPGVAVANQAESGLSLGSFKAQRRLDKILSVMRPGDFVLVQFGHNDQKDKKPGAGPFTTYKANLKEFVGVVRAKGGQAVVVTPMERRRFDASGRAEPTLADYAEAARQVGQEEKVPVIDLNKMSLLVYQALGSEGSKKAFVHYAAGSFPDQDAALKDDTHHNAFGGYELAKCVVEGIRADVPALKACLLDGLPAFDPSHPDKPEEIRLPASPVHAKPVKPAGN